MANYTTCVLFGMGYSNLDTKTSTKLLNVIMRHDNVDCTREYVWVKMVGAFKSISH